MKRILSIGLVGVLVFLFSASSAFPGENNCKIPSTISNPQGWSVNTFGFPKNELSMPTSGNVKLPVVFITYPDLKKPSEKDAKYIYNLFSKDATKYFKNLSHGKLNLVLAPNFSWLTMSKPSASYQSFGNSSEITREVYSLAQGLPNVSGAEGLIAVSDPATYAPGHMYGEASGKNSFALVGTANFYKYPSSDFIHELFHAFGLPDIQDFVADYSIMGNSHSGTELLAWEQYLLGWLSDRQVVCMSEGTKSLKLNPSAIKKGTKMVVVKISDTEVLVVESRKPLRYDNPDVNFGNGPFQPRFKNDGLLAYVVNSSIGDPNEGPLRLLNNKRSIKLGKKVRYKNVEISYVSKSPKSDSVIIKVN